MRVLFNGLKLLGALSSIIVSSVALGLEPEKVKSNARIMVLRLKGVTIEDSGSTYIGENVSVDKGTAILPGSRLKNCKIGENCSIGPVSTIQNSTIGKRVLAEKAEIKSSTIEDDVIIGANACVVGSTLRKGAQARFCVQVIRSEIGENSHAPHFAYIGDSTLEDDVNIGSHTATANYDSKEKHKTTIKSKAFIGCRTVLVAPVTVGKRAFIAAGSTITKNVPDGALAIDRNPQVNKEGWVEKRMQKQNSVCEPNKTI